MRLEQFTKSNIAEKALQANFGINYDFTKLNKSQTRDMLVKFHNIVKEYKTKNVYESHNNPSYLKAVMVMEALSKHYQSFSKTRIVLENQEVEKAQTTLAAQELVDEVQKMVEKVNDMLVKELPALTDSIQTEIGVNEGTAYNQAASGALTQLNQTLSQTRQALTDALNQLTGMSSADFGAPAADGGGEMAVTDVAAQAGPGGEEVVGAEMTAAPEAPPAEEPALAGGGVGRAKR